MARTLARIDWVKDNQIAIKSKINRNQNPELYKALMEADNRSGLVRELLREGLEIRKEQLDNL